MSLETQFHLFSTVEIEHDNTLPCYPLLSYFNFIALQYLACASSVNLCNNITIDYRSVHHLRAYIILTFLFLFYAPLPN